MIVNRFAALLLPLCTFAAPSDQNALHEARLSPNDLTRGSRVDPDAMIPVKIALKQSEIDNGYDLLMDVSDPSSSNYGKHWTAAQVHDKFAPSHETLKTVDDWLKASGVSSDRIMHFENKGWLLVQMTAKEAEDILQTEYFEYDGDDGSVRIGSDGYKLPQKVSQHIDYVRPGVRLSERLKKKTLVKRTKGVRKLSDGAAKKAAAAPNCSDYLTMECIKTFYHITDVKKDNHLDAVGVFEYGGDVYSQADIDQYNAYSAPQIPQGTSPNVVSVAGGQAPIDQGNAGFESDLDIEILMSLLYPHNITLYQVGAEAGNFFESWLDALDGSFCSHADKKAGKECGTAKLEKVVSVSWSSSENYETQAYQYRACNEFLKLGLQGHSLVFSSGDHGVGGRAGCIGDAFNPGFPANCPYILSVGATQLNTTDGVESSMYQPDAGPNFSSAGGFANYFSRPLYQQLAVGHYFNRHDPGYPYYLSLDNKKNVGKHGGLYNRLGRGFPDVSAIGADLFLYWQGSFVLGAGTSYSTPIWASILTLINQEREFMGKSSVGFVNPVLYLNTHVFNDITTGVSNANCGTEGFTPVEGWDPITGLGTPDYEKLLALYRSLP